MIFGNGLKKFDFARQNLDGRAKCLAQKNEKKTLYQDQVKFLATDLLYSKNITLCNKTTKFVSFER